MIWGLLACTTQLHVATSMPDAEIGVLRSTSSPGVLDPAAELRGKGKLDEKVSYSVFDTWWAWARAPGGEAVVQRYPTQVAVGPLVSCVAGAILIVPLLGCFWVSKPTDRLLTLDVHPPPPPPPPPAVIVAPESLVGCAKDTDCKGERICVDAVCVAP